MKKLTVIITALALSLSTATFAATKGPGKEALQLSLAKNFKLAENVTWKEKEDLNFAYFHLGHRSMMAAFDKNAKLIAVSRDLLTDDVPMAVTRGVKAKYANHLFTTPVTELVMDGETAYYCTVENKKESILIKCYADGSIDAMSKTKK